MTQVERLADFAVRASVGQLSPAAVNQLKVRVLDAIACAIGAAREDRAVPGPVSALRVHLERLAGGDGRGACTLIGGGRASPERAALHNGLLVRYLDFNDAYLAPRETCHPSDNLAPVLAAAELAGASGSDLLAALAVAYQVQCRLSDEAPVRARGFDHATQGAYAAAAGAARALGLDAEHAAHAIAISGTAQNPLRVTRTGRLSHWKGLAYPHTAFVALHATLLAMHGITGPLEVFEGNKGFQESVSGPFELDWSREDLERVTRTILKKHNAEIHAQTAVEAALELRARPELGPDHAVDRIERIAIDTFEVAHRIIGGGEEGDKTVVGTKEAADHSLQYMVSVALLDGELGPSQYRPDRIAADDVQSLLRRVQVRSDPSFSERFPSVMPVRVTVTLDDGRSIACSRDDYEGFHSRPMTFEEATSKLDRLGGDVLDGRLRRELVETLGGLEEQPIGRLAGLLAHLGPPGTRTGEITS